MPSFLSKAIYLMLKQSKLNQKLRQEIDMGLLDEHPKQIPSSHMTKQFHIQTAIIQDRKVYTWSKYPKKSRTVVFYLHGGAYVHGLSNMHFRLIKSLIKATGCTVVVPDYPLVPHASAEEIYGFLHECYDKVVHHQFDRIILMGDSAGGGLALGFAQQRILNGDLDQKHLMLLSPWLDVSMDDPLIETIQKKDPILNQETLRLVGKMVAGDHLTKDAIISPLYGSLNGIRSIAVWIGSSDLLYADAIALKKKANEEHVELDMHVYQDMLHTWMFFGLRESLKSIREMVNHIQAIEKEN